MCYRKKEEQSKNKMNCKLMLTYDTPTFMFNVYKNQLSRQTGRRSLTGPKTLPTILYTYMKLVTKYQIPAINSYWEICDEKYLGRTNRGKTVYPPPSSGSGGINIISVCIDTFSSNIVGILYHLKGHYLPNRKFLLPIKTIRYDWCLYKTCFCNL